MEDGDADLMLISPKISNVHRRAIMQAAHRTRRSLGVSTSEAMKAAWTAFRRALRFGWPLDRLIMPHEVVKTIRPSLPPRTLYTRESGRIAGSFAA
jgi:hypothetical protein